MLEFVSLLSRLVFGFVALALMALAASLVVYGGFMITSDSGSLDTRLLDAVGFLIISIAVFEVGKYLLEEEVIREREMRHMSEARKSLTRFIGTIIIVVLLEVIVTVFKVARGDLSDMVYPTLLLFGGVALILALGVFQRLSASVEAHVGPADEDERAPASQKSEKRKS